MKLHYTVVPIAVLMLAVSPAHILAHDWYMGLKATDGASCCSNRDCHPVDYRYNASKGLEVRIGRIWVPINSTMVLPLSSPDDHAHACYYFGIQRNVDEQSSNYLNWEPTGPVIRCVILPGAS